MALTQAVVLDAARAILDEYGLPDLTMRRLGDALGVKPGALYWHYASKQVLLGAIADATVAELPATGDGAWRAVAAQWLFGLRETLLRHRDSADVVMTARAMGVGAATLPEPLTATLRAAGLPDAEATAAVETVLHFALGHVLQEQGREQWQRVGGGPADVDERLGARSFGYGVGLLLDGIQVALDR